MMEGEIVVTTKGRALMEQAVKVWLPPYSKEALFANALWALDKYDAYAEYVTPLMLERLEREGYIMEATAVAEAERILLDEWRRRRRSGN